MAIWWGWSSCRTTRSQHTSRMKCIEHRLLAQLLLSCCFNSDNHHHVFNIQSIKFPITAWSWRSSTVTVIKRLTKLHFSSTTGVGARCSLSLSFSSDNGERHVWLKCCIVIAPLIIRCRASLSIEPLVKPSATMSLVSIHHKRCRTPRSNNSLRNWTWLTNDCSAGILICAAVAAENTE